MKVLSIIGARPQFVKEAIIQYELDKHPDVQEVVVHTGQHYDNNMSGIFFDVLNMRVPDYNLGISSSKHGEMTALMMIELEKVMIKEKPDIVLLYGDTNSTLAGGLVASKLKIKTAHIEAGLRQEPKDMPEEINRQIVDRISDYLFVPSKLGTDNLTKEGITSNVYFVGDVMYDVYKKMEVKFDFTLIEDLKLSEDEYIVMTMHRDFNVDNKETLKNILYEINRISKEKKVVFPIHPRTIKRINEYKLGKYMKDILVIEPIDYLKLMGLTKNAFKIITDSGGYQKESYFSGKQACVIMPDTGWRELIDSGYNCLVDYSNVYDNIFKRSNEKRDPNVYGDGDAAQKIIKVLKNKLK